MLHNLFKGLGTAALLILCLSNSTLALYESALTGAEKAEIVRAVLEAERERQGSAFESVTGLSIENIIFITPAGLAADFKLSLLSPDEIKEQAKSYIGVTYLAFKAFNVRGEHAVVKLAVTREETPCFGPYQKQQKEVIYRLDRTNGEWRAKVVGSPFGVKPNHAIQPTANLDGGIMWLFKKTQKEEDSCFEIIRDYLSILPEKGTWDDNELFEALVNRGHDKLLSWYIVGMIPIVAGRELMKDWGVKFSDSVVLYDENGEPTPAKKLNDFPVFRAIVKSWPDIHRHPNIKNLMTWGAEFHAVNKLMHKGSAKGIVLVEPGLLRPN